MHRTIFDPVAIDVDRPTRERVQEDFGKHVVERRNQMAELIRRWIETDMKFPVAIYDRLLDRVRFLNPSVRSDVATRFRC